jgi:ketosteroid isomerase-like protein
MSKLFCHVFTTFLLLTFASAQERSANPSDAPDQTRQAIVQLCTDWDNAYINKNLAALEKILSGDFVGIDDEGNVTAKTDEINLTKSGDLVITSVQRIEPLKVRFHGTTAVVTGFSFMRQKFKGADTTGRARFTIVCAQKGDRWQIVSWQSTKVKDKQP